LRSTRSAAITSSFLVILIQQLWRRANIKVNNTVDNTIDNGWFLFEKTKEKLRGEGMQGEGVEKQTW
jgi:hypothetical protein